MHSKLMGIKINGGLVNSRVEDLNKFRAIISFILRIIINQCEPIPLCNPIKKHIVIPIDITKDSRKIFFNKNSRCHELKFREKGRNSQTSPGIHGENQKLNCIEQSTQKRIELAVDLGSTREIDLRKISQRAGLLRNAADPRLRQRKCDRVEEAEITPRGG